MPCYNEQCGQSLCSKEVEASILLVANLGWNQTKKFLEFQRYPPTNG